MDCYIPETRITKVSMSGSGGGGIAMRAHDQHWGAATPGAHAYVTMATIVAPSPRSCDNSVRGLNLRPPPSSTNLSACALYPLTNTIPLNNFLAKV